MHPKIFLAGVFCALAIAAVDYLTGSEATFGLFYFIPVSLFAWNGSLRTALLMAVGAAILWIAADRLSGHVYQNHLAEYWNAGEQLVGCAAIAVVVHRWRRADDKSKRPAKSDELEDSVAYARAVMRRIDSDGKPRRR